MLENNDNQKELMNNEDTVNFQEITSESAQIKGLVEKQRKLIIMIAGISVFAVLMFVISVVAIAGNISKSRQLQQAYASMYSTKSETSSTPRNTSVPSSAPSSSSRPSSTPRPSSSSSSSSSSKKCTYTDLNGKQSCTRDSMSGGTLCSYHFKYLDDIYKDLTGR